jgi:signal transduction histidine kinase
MEIIYPVVYFISVFICGSLAFLVLLRDRKSKLNRSFFWLSLSIAGWILSLYFFYFLHDGNVLPLGRLNFAFTELIAVFIFYFAFRFPKESFKIRKSLNVLIFLWTVFLVGITLFTDLIDKEEIINNGAIKTIYGSFYFLFVVHFFLFFILFSIFSLLKYKNLENLERYQAKYFILGAFAAIIPATITNIVLPLFFDYFDAQYWGPFFTLLFTGAVTYSIIAHRFMNIQIILRSGSVYFLSFLTLIFFSWIFKYFLGFLLLENNFWSWSDFLVTVVAILVFYPIRNYYFKITNKYFFSSLYNSSQVIYDLSKKISSTLNDNEIYKLVCSTLDEAFHVDGIAILKYKKNHSFLRVKRSESLAFKNNSLTLEESLYEEYFRKGKLVFTEDLAKNKKLKESFGNLRASKIAIVVPLNVGENPVGIITIGSKESRDPYNKEDLEMLEVISAQVAIAIQNAISYKEIKEFSKKMEREVKKATKELTSTNKKLRKIDKAKSEFISIASHQLRTPLTSIKGFTSLLIDGSYGDISPEQKQVLEKVYISNERLIMLVEDLLNVSRIERGKLDYEFQEIKMVDLIESVIKIMNIQAKERNLFLKFENKAPVNFTIEADYRKLVEIIGNLVDNAIKYTEKGGVTVVLNKQKDSSVLIEVMDTGVGIKRTEIPKLFEKFSRGEGIHRLYAGGTGLGLYVVKKMTEAHGGKVWIKSAGEGKGSSFLLELPLHQKKIDQT